MKTIRVISFIRLLLWVFLANAVVSCNGSSDHSVQENHPADHPSQLPVQLPVQEGQAVNANDDRLKTNAAVNATEIPTDMVLIPAGPFIMGSNERDNSGKKEEYGLVNPLYLDENPQHIVRLENYLIDKLEVTNAAYKQFITETRSKEPFEWTQNGYNLIEARLNVTDLETLRWIAETYFKLDMEINKLDKPQLLQAIRKDWISKDLLPVTGVTWYEAQAYCQWIGKKLPSEAQWEKAARGSEGLKYPWGNEWDPKLTNTGDDSEWENGVAPVGSYPRNASPYGVYDMAGNVWEWVDDWYQAYPQSTFKHEAFGTTNKVIRGGGGGVGHYALSMFFRGAARSYAPPNTSNADVGFRCAKSL